MTWHDGRPPFYCGDTCLKAAQRAVRKIRLRLSIVTQAEEQASTVTTRIALASERRTLCWELQRYAGCLLDLDGVGQLATGRELDVTSPRVLSDTTAPAS